MDKSDNKKSPQSPPCASSRPLKMWGPHWALAEAPSPPPRDPHALPHVTVRGRRGSTHMPHPPKATAVPLPNDPRWQRNATASGLKFNHSDHSHSVVCGQETLGSEFVRTRDKLSNIYETTGKRQNRFLVVDPLLAPAPWRNSHKKDQKGMNLTVQSPWPLLNVVSLLAPAASNIWITSSEPRWHAKCKGVKPGGVDTTAVKELANCYAKQLEESSFENKERPSLLGWPLFSLFLFLSLSLSLSLRLEAIATS